MKVKYLLCSMTLMALLAGPVSAQTAPSKAAKQAVGQGPELASPPVSEASGGGGGTPCSGPITVRPYYCLNQGQGTLPLSYTGCHSDGDTYQWEGPNGTVSTNLNAVLFGATNPNTWGPYYLAITHPSGPPTYQDFTVVGPLTITATQGIGASAQVVTPGATVCQGAYMNFYIQENAGWSGVSWSISPTSAVVSTPTNPPRFSVQTTAPYSGPAVSYVVTCTATSPCGGQKTATFQFNSRVREGNCGQLERASAATNLSAGQAMAYPVPVAKMLTVPAGVVGTVVGLYNGQGVEVRQAASTGAELQLSTDDLPNGLYLLRTVAPTGKPTEQRIIVRH